jgi:hypothetical protein
MYVSEVYDSPRVAVQVFTMSYIDNLLHYESFYFVVCKLFNTYTKYENIIHISLCFLLIVWECDIRWIIASDHRREERRKEKNTGKRSRQRYGYLVSVLRYLLQRRYLPLIRVADPPTNTRPQYDPIPEINKV